MDFANYIYDTKSGKRMFNRPKPVTRSYKSTNEAYSQWLTDMDTKSTEIDYDSAIDIDSPSKNALEIAIPFEHCIDRIDVLDTYQSINSSFLASFSKTYTSYSDKAYYELNGKLYYAYYSGSLSYIIIFDPKTETTVEVSPSGSYSFKSLFYCEFDERFYIVSGLTVLVFDPSVNQFTYYLTNPNYGANVYNQNSICYDNNLKMLYVSVDSQSAYKICKINPNGKGLVPSFLVDTVDRYSEVKLFTNKMAFYNNNFRHGDFVVYDPSHDVYYSGGSSYSSSKLSRVSPNSAVEYLNPTEYPDATLFYLKQTSGSTFVCVFRTIISGDSIFTHFIYEYNMTSQTFRFVTTFKSSLAQDVGYSSGRGLKILCVPNDLNYSFEIVSIDLDTGVQTYSSFYFGKAYYRCSVFVSNLDCFYLIAMDRYFTTYLYKVSTSGVTRITGDSTVTSFNFVYYEGGKYLFNLQNNNAYNLLTNTVENIYFGPIRYSSETSYVFYESVTCSLYGWDDSSTNNAVTGLSTLNLSLLPTKSFSAPTLSFVYFDYKLDKLLYCMADNKCYEFIPGVTCSITKTSFICDTLYYNSAAGKVFAFDYTNSKLYYVSEDTKALVLAYNFGVYFWPGEVRLFKNPYTGNIHLFNKTYTDHFVFNATFDSKVFSSKLTGNFHSVAFFSDFYYIITTGSIHKFSLDNILIATFSHGGARDQPGRFVLDSVNRVLYVAKTMDSIVSLDLNTGSIIHTFTSNIGDDIYPLKLSSSDNIYCFSTGGIKKFYYGTHTEELAPRKVGFSNRGALYFPTSLKPVLDSLKNIDSVFDSVFYSLSSYLPSVVFSKLLNQDSVFSAINVKYSVSSNCFIFYAECYKVISESSSKDYTTLCNFAFKLFNKSATDRGHLEIVFSSKNDASRSYGLFELNSDKTSSIVVPDNSQLFSESVEIDKVYSYSTVPTYSFISSSSETIKDIATGKPVISKPKKVTHTYTSASDAYSKWKVGNFATAPQSNLLSTDDGMDSYPFEKSLLITPGSVGAIGFTSENGLHIYLNTSGNNSPSVTLAGVNARQYFSLGTPSLAIIFKNPNSDSKSYNGTYISIPDGFIMFCQFSHYSASTYRVDVAVKITKGGAIEVVTSAAAAGTYLGFLCLNQTNGSYNKALSEANGGFEVLLTDSVTCYKSTAYAPFIEETLHKVPSSVTIYNGGEFIVNSDSPNIRFYENSSDNYLRFFLNLESVESSLYKILLSEFGQSFAADVSSNKTAIFKSSAYSVDNKSYINNKPVFTYRNLNFLKYFRYDLFFNNNGKFELLSSNNTSINIKFPDYIFKTSGSKVFSIKLFFPNNATSKTYFYEKEFTIKCLPSTAFNLPVVNSGNNLTFTFDSYSVVLKSTDYGKFIVSSITNTDDNTTITKLKYRKTNSSNPFDVFEVGSEVSFIELINGVDTIQTNEDFSFNLTDSLEVYDPTNSNADSLSLNSALNNIKFLPNLYYDCTAHKVYSNSYIVGNTPCDLITTKFKNKPLFFFFVIRGKFSSDFKVVDDSGTSVDYIVDSKDSNLHFVYLNILKDKNYYYYNKGFKIPVMASFVSDEYYYNFTLPIGSRSIKFEEPTFIGLFNCELNINIKASFTLVDGSIITKSVNPNTPAYVYSLVKDISFFDDDSSPLGSENLTFVNYFPLTHYVSGVNVLEKSLDDIVYIAKSVRDYDIPEDSVLQNETLYAVENGKLVEYEDGYIYSLATDDLLSYSNPFDRVEYTSKSKAFGYKVPSSTSPKLINLFNKHFKTIGLPIVKE